MNLLDGNEAQLVQGLAHFIRHDGHDHSGSLGLHIIELQLTGSAGSRLLGSRRSGGSRSSGGSGSLLLGVLGHEDLAHDDHNDHQQDQAQEHNGIAQQCGDRRIAHGQSPMHADRGHIHHRLIDMGLNQKQAVATLYVISGILGLSAVVLTTGGEAKAMLLLIALCVVAVVAARVVFPKEVKEELHEELEELTELGHHEEKDKQKEDGSHE